MVRQSSKREDAEAVRSRYQRAGKREKGRILDQFVGATGYHRVYARRLLRTTPAAVERMPTKRAPRPRQYGPADPFAALRRGCYEPAGS